MATIVAKAYRLRTFHNISSLRPQNNVLQSFAELRFFSDEVEEAPKKKQNKVVRKDKKAKGGDGQRNRELELIMAALDAPMKKEPPISEEEKARRYNIGRNYVIGRMRQHNALNHDLTCKIKMKLHAIDMLPRNSRIKEEALKISDEMPPAWRKFPSWTPPIPGYEPEEYVRQSGEN